MSTGTHFLRPLLQKGHAPALIRDRDSGRVVATELELTLDSESRRRGLLGREGIDDDAAMIIAPCNGVHTFFMRFTIDVVYVGKQGQVLKVCRRMKPWRLSICLRAFAAIELAAGSIDRAGIAGGHTLEVAEK